MGTATTAAAQAAPQGPPAVIPLQPPSSSAPSYASYTPPPPAPEPQLVREPDYRWQLVVSDLGVIGMLASARESGVELGLLTYAFAAPIIHEANADGTRALSSLGLRLGLPLAGALTMGFVAKAVGTCGGAYCDSDDGPVASMLVGALVGMAAAIVIDDVYIGRPRTIESRGISLSASVDKSRTTVGLAGRF
ncbi:MAG TPA: hypothetical protein VGC42_30195 [Kofleriaceae bacterium]